MYRWFGLPPIGEYGGLNLCNLTLNSAYVIANTTLENAFVYTVDNYCYECPFYLEKHLKKGIEEIWTVGTSESVTWRIMNNKDLDVFPRSRQNGILCEMRPRFHEYGVYHLDVGRCEAKLLISSTSYDTYLPLLLFVLMLLACGIIYSFIKFALRCKSFRCNEYDFALNSNADLNEKTGLHVFRGVILTLLIFIGSGGGGYPIFTNKYGGLSVLDGLFFIFTWSIGINIPITVDLASKGQKKINIFGNILIKALILILLGITIDSTSAQFPNESPKLWRPILMIGVSYLFVGTVYLLSVRRVFIKAEEFILKVLSNFMSLLWCWVISGFVLTLMVVLIYTLTTYNCIITTPIGLSKVDYWYAVDELSTNCNNNHTKIINTFFTGEDKNTLFVDGYLFFSGGLLGIFSTIMCMMIGLKAGVIYFNHEVHKDKTKLWGLWATVFAMGGIVFAAMSMAVRLNLWPISSILLLTASSHLILMVVYSLTEASQNNSYTMKTLGQSSLVIFCGHLLFSNSLPFSVPMNLNNHGLILLQNLWTILLWIIISVFLKRSKIDLSI